MLNTVIMNIFGPFITWKTQKWATNVKFEAIENEDFLSNRSEKYKILSKSIEDLGFSCIGSSVLNNEGGDIFFRLYWDSNSKIAAMCVSATSPIEEVVYMGFSQKYSDGSIMNISNNPFVEVCPKTEIKSSYRFPSVSDAKELLDIFNQIKRKYSSEVVDFDTSSAFKEMEHFTKLESDELVSKGILKPEIDDEGKRALTLYGAICLTYRAISPGRNIFGYLSERESKKMLSSAIKIAFN